MKTVLMGTEEVETKGTRPFIKTERRTGPQAGIPQTAIRTSLWIGPELSDSRAEFSPKVGKTETVYVW